jgi:hypothetical protein
MVLREVGYSCRDLEGRVVLYRGEKGCERLRQVCQLIQEGLLLATLIDHLLQNEIGDSLVLVHTALIFLALHTIVVIFPELFICHSTLHHHDRFSSVHVKLSLKQQKLHASSHLLKVLICAAGYCKFCSKGHRLCDVRCQGINEETLTRLQIDLF